MPRFDRYDPGVKLEVIPSGEMVRFSIGKGHMSRIAFITPEEALGFASAVLRAADEAAGHDPD